MLNGRHSISNASEMACTADLVAAYIPPHGRGLDGGGGGGGDFFPWRQQEWGSGHAPYHCATTEPMVMNIPCLRAAM
jgi:hypothetical protein